MSTTGEAANEIRPFHIGSEEALEDLRRRIAATSWPSQELVADRSRACSWPRSRRSPATGPATTTGAGASETERAAAVATTIDEVEIHFIHVKSRHENALPLIMTHGWPGSVIEPCSTPSAPSPTRPRTAAPPRTPSTWCCRRCLATASRAADRARLESRPAPHAWAELMGRLGYTRLGAATYAVPLVTDLMGRQAVEDWSAAT